MHVRQRLGASETSRVSRTGSAALDAAPGEEATWRRGGATHGRDTVGEPVRQVRVSPDHEPAAYRGLGGEPQACGAYLEAGGAESAQTAAEARSAVAQRRIVHPAEAAVSGPRLVVRLRGSRTHDGRALKLLTVLDEHTRECLAIVVARKIRAHDVLEVLADLFVRHGPPEYLRSEQRTGVHREARAAVVGARGRRDALYRAGAARGRTATTRASTASSGTSC